LPRSSPAKSPSLLIAAVSGRSLAAAAKRAGFVPLVADFFADADTGRIAHACLKLDGEIKRGLKWKHVAPALEALAKQAPSPLLGLVYGSGFEDRVELLAKLAERWPLLGNDASTVERVKAPKSFFGALAHLGVPHPRTVTEPPPAEDGWLAKRQGRAGGSHIVASHVVTSQSVRHAVAGANPERRTYFQEKVQGRAVSALFVGNGDRARVLGFSEQWTAPTKAARWRYGGAVRPAELSSDLEEHMTDSVERVARTFELKGLGSADFLLSEGERNEARALLLEINPRPGATLDVFDSEARPLIRLHLDAVLEHRLPDGQLNLPEASAAAIVYAMEPVTVSRTMEWPDWTADRPKWGECIDKNRPICTVLARSGTKAEAKRLTEERISIILAACARQRRGNQ
jgi:predicted ATP-grasp superfamily ATP-dependent carboligase